jgi:hypothetical protein
VSFALDDASHAAAVSSNAPAATQTPLAFCMSQVKEHESFQRRTPNSGAFISPVVSRDVPRCAVSERPP